MKPNMSREAKKAQNVSCCLLSQEENQKVFERLGKQCLTLSTTVAQVFLTEEPHHATWVKKHCGVICFIKDGERRSFFIRLLDMEKLAWVWEQELYNQFVYKPSCTFFHTFEADNCMAGLNFADNEEAMAFKTAVQKKLLEKEEKKRERRKAQQTVQPSNAGIVAARAKSESMPSLNVNEKKDVEKRRRRGGKKLTKGMISNPTNFTHVQHVGWHPEKGFSIENVDQELQDFFNLAGVSDKDLKDNDTRDFIYDFICKNGGVERAKKEIVKSTPPPLPVRDAPLTPKAPRVPNTMRSNAPPPPPSVAPMQQRPPVAKHAVAPPPPPIPPPPSSMPPPPPSAVPPPPPPPPPPPMPGLLPPQRGSAASVAPPPPPPPTALPKATDVRSALLDQIKRGKELNHVEINGSAGDSLNAGDDSRDALLNQIRRGVALKSVTEDQRSLSGGQNPSEGLAGALARALQERNMAIHHTDDSDSYEDEDDDDWED